MVDAVFITPNMNGEPAEESVGTLQLVTILQSKGVSCEILQFFRIGSLSDFAVFVENAVNKIRALRPKIVSFYTRCDTYHIVLKLAQRIKECFPDMYIVFGGPQSDITAAETVEQIPYVDFVCCGEGENTVFPLFSSLLKCEPDLSVPGLVYRLNGAVMKNPRPELVKNLDSLQIIDYSKFHFTGVDKDSENGYFPIDVGRGCPFGCTYCSTKTVWGRKYRLKSPERIAEEVKNSHAEFGVTRFAFAHDMFTLNREKVIETCRILSELDFNVEWRCSARLDCLDCELIDVMAESGMRSIFIGIETGSARMQKIINKNLCLDRAVEIVKYLTSKKVAVTASFIYGFPEETEEDLSETVSLIAKLMDIKGVDVQTHLCTFLPGTEMSLAHMHEMKPVKQYSDITGNVAVEECRDIIDAHPELFRHMLEYETELRTKLQYFKMFFIMWRYMLPVYRHISGKYESNRLIEMYYDFAEANGEILYELKDLPASMWLPALVRGDLFVKRFSEDEYYDIISDFYRMRIAETSDEVKNGGSVTDVFCFSPADRKMHKFLTDYERLVAMVTFSGGKDGNVRYSVNVYG